MIPCYWMHETTGAFRPAVEAYLTGLRMSEAHIAAMRAYLRQWITVPEWLGGDAVTDLRARIDQLTTRNAIAEWLNDATDLGIDPL